MASIIFYPKIIPFFPTPQLLSLIPYLLKPVIRTITTVQDGTIKGVVFPAAAHPAIYAIAGSDTASTYPDSSGKFLIRGLKNASYSLLFKPLSPFRDTAFTGVSVVTGYITNVDTVIMH